MWINRGFREPKNSGCYKVFGTVNIGTPYETRCKFDAYWQPESKRFTDFVGEDLVGINEAVEYWYDFEQVDDPKQ